jgi:hypothetical protein
MLYYFVPLLLLIMAPPSQKPTDFTSEPQMTIDPTVAVRSASSEVLYFDCIFRATYPKSRKSRVRLPRLLEAFVQGPLFEYGLALHARYP